jgi:hypothetical protein
VSSLLHGAGRTAHPEKEQTGKKKEQQMQKKLAARSLLSPLK